MTDPTGTDAYHQVIVMQCEQHPGTIWPHGTCAGPGMPLWDEPLHPGPAQVEHAFRALVQAILAAERAR